MAAPKTAPKAEAPDLPDNVPTPPPRERYEVERMDGGYVLLVNGAIDHGPDLLAVVFSKLEARVFHRAGIIGNGPLPMPKGATS